MWTCGVTDGAASGFHYILDRIAPCVAVITSQIAMAMLLHVYLTAGYVAASWCRPSLSWSSSLSRRRCTLPCANIALEEQVQMIRTTSQFVSSCDSHNYSQSPTCAMCRLMICNEPERDMLVQSVRQDTTQSTSHGKTSPTRRRVNGGRQ